MRVDPPPTGARPRESGPADSDRWRGPALSARSLPYRSTLALEQGKFAAWKEIARARTRVDPATERPDMGALFVQKNEDSTALAHFVLCALLSARLENCDGTWALEQSLVGRFPGNFSRGFRCAD